MIVQASTCKLSVIIPARNEFPNICHTVHSIWNCLDADGFKPQEFEIIIVNNASDDRRWPQRGTGGTTDHLMTRGAYYNRMLRVVYDPIPGNHSTRNKGAAIARGEYLFFSDGHMAYKPGFFKSILETVDKRGGLVHGSLQFIGAYPVVESSMGYQYTWKLGDECRQTWANYKLSDQPWYIIGQGAWGMACKRAEFLLSGGYERYHKTYGGEFFITSKAWMMGSSVSVDPNAVGWHLASGRGYSYDHMEYVENILNLLYALGADDWRERTYINYLRTKNKAQLDEIMERGAKLYAKERAWIAKKSRFTFNQLLTERPWEKKNIELYGKSNCGMLVFHWSELELIAQSPVAKEAYLKSKYQQELGEFIEVNMIPYIYRHNEWVKKHGIEKLINFRKTLEW